MKKIKIGKIKSIQPSYSFADVIEVGKEYAINGFNIWNYYWHCKDRDVEVVDPKVGEIYHFKEYEIRTPETPIFFVAGEFSNGDIGIFLRNE